MNPVAGRVAPESICQSIRDEWRELADDHHGAADGDRVLLDAIIQRRHGVAALRGRLSDRTVPH